MKEKKLLVILAIWVCMYVRVSDSYCDTFADSIDRGILNNKLPIVYYMF